MFRAELDENDRYWVYWNIDEVMHAAAAYGLAKWANFFSIQASKSITFAARAKTTGWVGLGISPNSKMPYSDFVMAWVGSAPN